MHLQYIALGTSSIIGVAIDQLRMTKRLTRFQLINMSRQFLNTTYLFYAVLPGVTNEWGGVHVGSRRR